MKYTTTPPKTDSDFSNKLLSEGWIKIKKPSNTSLLILSSVPFMFINGFIFMIITYFLYPDFREFLTLAKSSTVELTIDMNLINSTTILEILTIYLFTLFHEFIHACFIPNFLKSNKTYWGINMFYGFVYTEEEIKKNRYIIISIMPFILLSIILPLILSILGLLNEFILFLCFINAIGSSVDCLNIYNILRQTPRNATIINNGFEIFYK